MYLIRSNELNRILSENDRNAAYKGFTMVVFEAMWMSPGRKISATALLKCLRRYVSCY